MPKTIEHEDIFQFKVNILFFFAENKIQKDSLQETRVPKVLPTVHPHPALLHALTAQNKQKVLNSESNLQIPSEDFLI